MGEAGFLAGLELFFPGFERINGSVQMSGIITGWQGKRQQEGGEPGCPPGRPGTVLRTCGMRMGRGIGGLARGGCAGHQ